MIVPGRLALAVGAILMLLLIAGVVDERISAVVAMLDLGLIGCVLLTGRRLRGLALDVRRQGEGRAQVGKPHEISFRIANRSAREIVVRLRQTWPAGVTTDGESIEVAVAAGEVVTATFVITPTDRGSLTL